VESMSRSSFNINSSGSAALSPVRSPQSVSSLSPSSSQISSPRHSLIHNLFANPRGTWSWQLCSLCVLGTCLAGYMWTFQLYAFSPSLQGAESSGRYNEIGALVHSHSHARMSAEAGALDDGFHVAGSEGLGAGNVDGGMKGAGVLAFAFTFTPAQRSAYAENIKAQLLSTQRRMLTTHPKPAIGIPFATKIGLTEAELFLPVSRVNIWDLYPPDASCPALERVGSVGDGGKWICDVGYFAPQHQASASAGPAALSGKSCVVFSYGVETDSSFEEALLEGTRCKVFAFDPTVGGIASGRGYANTLFVDSHGIPLPNTSDTVVQPVAERSVFFEKVALGKTSGGAGPNPALKARSKPGSGKENGKEDDGEAPHMHLLSETLLDGMRRHKVQFVDILKVDVEGGEWEALEPLLDLCADGAAPPVFGQLLVELHYHTAPELQRLFDQLRSCGFLNVNREVNVQPCINSNLCLAAEYTFIHPAAYYAQTHPPLPSDSAATPVAATGNVRGSSSDSTSGSASKAWLEKPNAVIYFLSQKSRLDRLAAALQLLYVNLLAPYPFYPVVIFHDDIFAVEQEYLTRALERIRAKNGPVLKLHFIEIKLDFPLEYSAAERTEDALVKGTKMCPASLGYRHMCNFHAFSALPLLQQHGYKDHEYIMRLDDDSHISSPVGYDPFHLMKVNHKKYGFVKVMNDDPRCVHGLWPLAKKFLDDSLATQLISPQQYNAALNTSSTDSVLALLPSPSIFYNNFEISHKSVWEGPVWEAWKRTVTQSKNVYLRRWGDAPIHTIAAAIMLRKDQLHAFKDIPYRHLPFIDQVGSGLPRPHADPFDQKSGCFYYDHWVCQNGTASGSLAGLLPTPEWGQQALEPSPKQLAQRESKNRAVLKSTLDAVLSGATSTSASAAQANEANAAVASVLAAKNSAEEEYVESVSERLQRQSGLLTADDQAQAMAAIASAIVRPGDPNPVSNSWNVADGTAAANRAGSAANPARGVLYTYAFDGFEEIVARTVSTFYTNFAVHHGTPFVVFYTKGLGFKPDSMRVAVQKLISDHDASIAAGQAHALDIRFIETPLNAQSEGSIATDDGICVAGNAEGRSSSLFLREAAVQILADMGYSYYWRFAMDSALTQQVKRDIFVTMRNKGHVYGFRGVIRENPGCVHDAWDLARSICSGEFDLTDVPAEEELRATASGNAATTVATISNGEDKNLQEKRVLPNVHCSDLLYKWEKGSIFFTSFEISSKSLFQAVVTNKLLKAIKAKEAAAGMIFYGDALVHTLSVLMSQPQEAVTSLQDIPYTSFSAFGYLHLAPKVASSAATPAAEATKTAQIPSKPLVKHEILQLLPPPLSLPSFDAFVEPKLFGWLGADVGASFLLPDVASTSSASASAEAQYIWLYGDTLVGTSTAEKRLEATMISNSIGIAVVTPAADSTQKEMRWSELRSMHYYWQSSPQGAPQALLEATEHCFYRTLPPAPPPQARPRYIPTGASAHFVPVVPNKGDLSTVAKVLSKDEEIAVLLHNKPKFWPTGGAALYTQPAGAGKAGKGVVAVVVGKLVLPIAPAARRSELLEDAETGLAFNDVGCAVFLVQNPHSSPDQWVYTVSLLPFRIPVGMALGESSEDGGRSVPEVLSDTYLWTTIATTAPDAEFMYMTGSYRNGKEGSRRATFDVFGAASLRLERTIMARIPTAGVLVHDHSKMEVLYAVPAANGGSGSEIAMWSKMSAGIDLSTAADPATRTSGDKTIIPIPYKLAPSSPESSLHFDAGIQRWVLITLVPLSNIRVCISPVGDLASLAGTSARFTCHEVEVPKKWISDDYITYAAKAHPELLPSMRDTGGGTGAPRKHSPVVITFVSNPTRGPYLLLLPEHRSAYTPRFFLM